MFNPHHFNAWFDFVIKGVALLGMVGTALAASWASWFWCKRMARRLVRALHLSDDFHTGFGVNPVDAIEKRFSGLELRLSRSEIVAELRQKHYGFAVYICDRTGSCTFVNEALCQLFQISREEALEHGWARSLPPEDMERVVVAWETAIRLNMPYEQRYTVHGVPCITRAVPLRIDGEVHEFIGYVVPE